VLDLGFGRCKFALAVPKGTDFYGGYRTKRIATKYPKGGQLLLRIKGHDVEVIKIEARWSSRRCSRWRTGSWTTRKRERRSGKTALEIIEEIRCLRPLIVNVASMKTKKAEIERLISDIQGR
jgi:ATP phosphoribosyltransferase